MRECSNCRRANPPEAAFCMNCGSQLTLSCRNCGAELPRDARFCMQCGQPVETVHQGDAARLSALAAQTPGRLAEKMKAATHLAGERRVVTVLFADVVGSTALAEQMDPEDWTALMNQVFDLLIPAVYRYEGTIARLMGDAVLAFFGAPVAHEDDPVRAVRAALDLVAAARTFNRQKARPRGLEFAVRVGINTGAVVVGTVGNDLVYEYTAMGDAVNLAARLQAAARPMTVLLSEHTHRYVKPVFELLDLGPLEVKGKAEPVNVFEVLSVKPRPEPLRGLVGMESPMVGRDSELKQLLKASQAVAAGVGRVALVLGEPGLGKSRLVAEWKAAQTAEPGQGSLRWAEAHSLSYGQGLAYHLLVDMLRNLLGLPVGAGEVETQRALQELVEARVGIEGPEIYPFLAHLLALPLDKEAREQVQHLDPQALQTQYFLALRQLIGSLAGQEPLALIFEDVHWADPSSSELLIRLLPLMAESPVLFCFVSRPDRDAPGWKLIQATREALGGSLVEINVTALSAADSRQLVINLLQIEALPDRTRNLILEKAEGVPFFVEEIIRMLMDQGALIERDGNWVAGVEIENIEIPDNLHGLLLARIDRLPEEAKRVLRVASVIGRQFSVKVLDRVLEAYQRM